MAYSLLDLQRSYRTPREPVLDLNFACEFLGQNQGEIAKALGVHWTTISDIAGGRLRPGPRILDPLIGLVRDQALSQLPRRPQQEAFNGLALNQALLRLAPGDCLLTGPAFEVELGLTGEGSFILDLPDYGPASDRRKSGWDVAAACEALAHGVRVADFAPADRRARMARDVLPRFRELIERRWRDLIALLEKPSSARHPHEEKWRHRIDRFRAEIIPGLLMAPRPGASARGWLRYRTTATRHEPKLIKLFWTDVPEGEAAS